MRFGALVVTALALAGCAPRELVDAASVATHPAEAIAQDVATDAAPHHWSRRMRRDEAERYALSLVNRDRAVVNLPPVGWDVTAARAAARHAADIARHGFTAHIGTDGSVPELRYTEAGGTGLVMENVGCLADAAARELDPDPTIDPAKIEEIERSFLDELPPNDGHRRNILAPHHTAIGIAVSATKGLDFACMTEEFVDDYGSLADIPKRAKIGQTIHVAGELKPPAVIAGVGLSRVDAPRPRPPSELNQIDGYTIPKPFVVYFGRGFKTPRPVEIHGNDFAIDVPLTDADKPGLYGVSVWASFNGSKELELVSLRVVRVD
jgi:uncharacterized protein YkwD